VKGLHQEPVVIIGGGLSGLAAGIFLAKNGFDVELFEANSKIGGSCATTALDGYTFNDGALYLVLLSVIDRAFATLGLDRAEVLPVRKITANFSATLWDGTVVTLGEGLDVRVNEKEMDARSQGQLHTLLGKWEPVLRFVSEELLTHPFSPWRVIRKGWRHLHKLRGTVASVLARCVSNNALRAALSGTILHSGLPPEQAPVSSILGLIAMMTEGFYLPEGGMGRIAEVLGCALERNGGKVHLDSKVQKIIIKDGQVCGVDVQGYGRVDADRIVSTASPMLTFSALFDADHLPSATRRKLQHVRLSHCAVSLQFGLSNTVHARSHVNMWLPPMDRQREIFTQDAQQVMWPVYSVPTLTMPELAPRGGSIVEMFHPVPQGIAPDDWDENRKELLRASAVETLGRAHDLDIVVTRVRSPKDFRDTMQLYEGAVYGLSPTSGPRELFAHRTPIDGLFLAGQCTYPGYGVSASVMSGIFAAEELMNVLE
jgi:phytoene desaturase